MRLPQLERRIAEKAQIGGTGLHMPGMGAELCARLMQVDLLRAEAQCHARRAPGRCESFGAHPQHPRIEFDRRSQIGHCQDQMIQCRYLWCHFAIVPCQSRA